MGERLQPTLKNLISFPDADFERECYEPSYFLQVRTWETDLRKDFSQSFLVQEALWKILFFSD